MFDSSLQKNSTIWPNASITCWRLLYGEIDSTTKNSISLSLLPVNSLLPGSEEYSQIYMRSPWRVLFDCPLAAVFPCFPHFTPTHQFALFLNRLTAWQQQQQQQHKRCRCPLMPAPRCCL
ncbi:unnamed protein product [Ceratitis capitata]|uniref:(Mediterranean fruit fly) hypothetical protein n=1 Tax=Ceratitis capitata TaxID=7213 RepID=A0A811VMV1_CERCA|nr:unnamed protein product [Ceratitis capitata]